MWPFRKRDDGASPIEESDTDGTVQSKEVNPEGGRGVPPQLSATGDNVHCAAPYTSCEKRDESQSIIAPLHSYGYQFTGEKSKDLILCVLEAIHTWKAHYKLNIPDAVLMDQIIVLFNKLREINRDN